MDIDYVYNEINLMELLRIEIRFMEWFFFLQLDLKSFNKNNLKKQDWIVYVDEVSYLKLKSFYFGFYAK